MKQQQKNTGNFLSTFASSSKHNGKPQPRIGPPFMPKSSASTSTTNIIHEILTDEEIKQILAHNWQNPDLNPLTSTEISWLMCLRPGSQSPTSITTAGPAPKSFHHRNVSNDSTLVSLSSSISSSLQTTTTSSPPSSAAATASTTTQQSSEFSNAEAQAQHQREMEIANNKELRARDFANRHAQCQPQSQTPGMPSAAAPSATLSSTSPSSFSSMSLSLSRLPASTATAAPFIPFRDAALVEVAQNTEDIISGIGAQIRDLQRALGNLGSGGNALEGL
ncbi:MAG: hypothetical protein M1830_007075 [Pleopsidium flavum]|nr:MAG: hypothetical protein M1830_007075 [Pleopsidium flavum]